MPKKKASGWDWPGLRSGGGGILELQKAGKMPPDEDRGEPSARFAREEPPACAPAGPLCQQPAPLGRTSHARLLLLCALEAPLVHQVSLDSCKDRQISCCCRYLNRGWRGATTGGELKGVPPRTCRVKQKCTQCKT